MPKYPDNIVFNENSEHYDASKRSYPTNVGSQKFEPIKLDKTNSINANNYFTKLDSLEFYKSYSKPSTIN